MTNQNEFPTMPSTTTLITCQGSGSLVEASTCKEAQNCLEMTPNQVVSTVACESLVVTTNPVLLPAPKRKSSDGSPAAIVEMDNLSWQYSACMHSINRVSGRISAITTIG